jgi:hypothetical protein
MYIPNYTLPITLKIIIFLGLKSQGLLGPHALLHHVQGPLVQLRQGRLRAAVGDGSDMENPKKGAAPVDETKENHGEMVS